MQRQPVVSPARQCDDARLSVAALRRKVSAARRAQSAASGAIAFQESVSKRHEQILRERKEGEQLCNERLQRDQAMKQAQRQSELQRRAFQREAMYDEFAKRRSEVTALKGHLKATAESAKQDRLAWEQQMRSVVKEERSTHTVRRLTVVEQIEAERLAAHESRKAEEKRSRQYIDERSLDRSLTIAAAVRDIRTASHHTQDARRRVEERNLETKRKIVDEAQRLRKAELDLLKKEASSLQMELSQLSRY
jgi:hypothetical protein